MKDMLIATLSVLAWIAGCHEYEPSLREYEWTECKRLECETLKTVWQGLEEENIGLFAMNEANEPVYRLSLEELEEIRKGIFWAVNCGMCKAHPLSDEWLECDTLKDILEYLETEKAQRIAFCDSSAGGPPENWHTVAEISKPERLEKAVELLSDAVRKTGKCPPSPGLITISSFSKMKIITDRHKFITPAEWQGNKAVYFHYGIKSCALRKQLRKWRFFDSR